MQTIEELEARVKETYSRWMYFEAAERGYDLAAASEALREHSAAVKALDDARSRERDEQSPLEEAFSNIARFTASVYGSPVAQEQQPAGIGAQGTEVLAPANGS